MVRRDRGFSFLVNSSPSVVSSWKALFVLSCLVLSCVLGGVASLGQRKCSPIILFNSGIEACQCTDVAASNYVQTDAGTAAEAAAPGSGWWQKSGFANAYG